MLRNPDVAAFFAPLSAHGDLAEEFLAALAKLGDCRVVHAPREYGALYAVTNDTVFAGAAGGALTYWRLGPEDEPIALASGGVASGLGKSWVEIELFRSRWPRPDLGHWARAAYCQARSEAAIPRR